MSYSISRSGPFLLLMDDGEKKEWINPSHIVRAIEVTFDQDIYTRVAFVNGDERDFRMTLDDFFGRIRDVQVQRR